MFDRPGVFYFKNPFTIFDDEWLIDQQKINKLKQHQIVVADFSSEHYGPDGLLHVYNALENSNINFILLSHHPQDHLILPRMFFYPHWYYYSQINFERIQVTKPRKYKLGCLNGKPRNARIANYLMLQKNVFWPEMCVNMFNADPWRADDVELDENEINEWRFIRSGLPKRSFIDHQSIKLPALDDSYIHLVTETTVIPRLFISEKTWKPIAAGNLFLVFGNQGTVAFLREQGVDVFDDIIDHSYDNCMDWRERLWQIHIEINKLLQQDLEELFRVTLHRRLANQTNFFNGIFDTHHTTDILDCLENHVPCS